MDTIDTHNIYFADFETTSQTLSKTEAHVALWFIDNGELGYYIDTFMKRAWKNKDIIYFHNLSFDGEFIIEWLKKERFVYDRNLRRINTFCFLKTLRNNVFFIKVRFRKRIVITFFDSLKLIPLRIAEIGKLTKNKEVIDYEIFNELYLSKNKKFFCELNPHIVKYIKRDVFIISDFLRKINETEKILSYMTIARFSLNNFTTDKYFLFNYLNKISKQQWSLLNYGYFGGFCMVNPKYKNKILEGEIYHYDVNSYYPYIMKTFKLPYGKMIVNNDTLKPFLYNFFWIRIKRAKKKDKKMINHLHLEHSFNIQYLAEVNETMDCVYSEDEWNEIKKDYVLDYEIIETFSFKKKIIFKDYITRWMRGKMSVDKKNPLYTFYKIAQNSLYGKFGQRHIFLSKYLDKDYNEVIQTDETNRVYPLMIAMGITSYARCGLFKIIRELGDNFIYCDTDSIMTWKPFKKELLDDKIYGKWKMEKVKKVKIIRSKCYYLINGKNEYKSAVSGFPIDKRHLINFDNFKIGSVFKDVKLMCKSVKGGKLLIKRDFTIKRDFSINK